MGKNILRLYISGVLSLNNLKTVEDVNKIFENYPNGVYELKIINLLDNPELAERDNIIATPTLVLDDPVRPRMVIGDMSNSERVLSALNLKVPDTDNAVDNVINNVVENTLEIEYRKCAKSSYVSNTA